ncbi:MAG TPA: M20/M25/M40 family metallo-hydrolase, partial [Thermoanaerobaculia bacterium]|nr:M20/M25/M40 family metallo-hydrolase [Thermoanaerobaculia bacterium]
MPRPRPASLALRTLLVLIAGGTLAALEVRPATPSTRSSSAGAPRAAVGLDGAGGGEAVDLEVVTRIRDEGFHRSQALATAAYLTDRIGPRLTGTPELKEANEWTRGQLAGWGLANAHLEAWRFGRAWSFSRAVVAMSMAPMAPMAAPLGAPAASKAIPEAAAPETSAPRWTQLQALPKAWTPGTPGEVRGEAVRVTIDAPADMDRYRGKLAGKVVLLDKAHDVAGGAAAPEPRRLTPEKLAELAAFSVNSGPSPADRQVRRERFRLRGQVRRFLVEEKALASIEVSPLPWGLIRVMGGGPYKEGDDPAVTGLVMAAEPYNRLVRLLDAGQRVELAVDVQARTWDDDPMAYNTIAEIPGSDPRGEVVMTGAHLDSWHAGTGATGNAAGCAVAMEAVRILSALHLKPRRTIRVALWTGEEEGLLGSAAYVSRHFASRPEPAGGTGGLPSFMLEPQGPLTIQPEHAKLSAYFNVDNGSGRVRGITAQENAAVQPIFTAWLAPLADLGATTVSQRSVGATDHVSFDRVGLP